MSDPRKYGSKNPGATNVFRSGDRIAGFLTLLGDFGKGYISVYLAVNVSENLINIEDLVQVISIVSVALAVVLGHIFPVFHGFKGGKGVATTFGVIFAISIPLGILSVTCWVFFYFLTKISGLSAIFTALATPVFSYFTIKIQYPNEFWLIFGTLCLLSTVLLIRHFENIMSLWKNSTLPKKKR